MSVQCGSMNSSTTTRPRRPASDMVRPAWSVSVNPGAARTGAGDNAIRSASEVETLAGSPDGLSTAADGCCRAARGIRKANKPATTTPTTTAPVISTAEPRRRGGPGPASSATQTTLFPRLGARDSQPSTIRKIAGFRRARWQPQNVAQVLERLPGAGDELGDRPGNGEPGVDCDVLAGRVVLADPQL